MSKKKKRPVISRRNPTQQRSMETVAAIEEATAQVLVEHGFENTSTNKIAERAGVSIGSLYQYFPNLNSVLDHIIERQIGRHFEVMSARLEAVRGLPIEHAVTEILRTGIELHSERREVRAMLFQRLTEFRVAAKIPLVEDRFQELLERAFQAGGDPRVKLANPKIASFVLVQTVLGVMKASLYQNRKIDRDALFEELRRMVLLYLTSGATDGSGAGSVRA